MTVSMNLTINEIAKYLHGRLFKQIERLRIFNCDGIELFQEDLRFLKDLQILYASSNGEDFDSLGSFKEYKIVQVLGEGGFGKVMLGKHKLTNDYVAIKILNTSVIGNAEDIDVVFREAQLLQALNHKNIVKIFKCYTLSNMKVVFVMEYLEGGELLQYLKDKKYLDEEEVKIFIRQISDAINYCHSQKLIHRDLKLENVLLTSPNKKEIKIVDFGISGISTFSMDNINAGSLMYMAPEVLLGKIKFIGPSIDIWAIGVMMYALLCGTLPFQGDSSGEIIQNIVKANPSYTNNLSQLSKHLMSKIFVADPLKRIKLIDILKHPWLMDSMIKEQQRQKDIFSKRESVLKSGLNQISTLQLIRLYGGVTNLKNQTKQQTRNSTKHLLPINLDPGLSPISVQSKYDLSPMKDSTELKKSQFSSSLDKVHERGEFSRRPVITLQIPNLKRRFQKHHTPEQTLITKRYSKVLEVYKVMDKISKSLSPRTDIVQTNNQNVNLPQLKKVQPFLRFNQKKLTIQEPESEDNLYFVTNKLQTEIPEDLKEVKKFKSLLRQL